MFENNSLSSCEACFKQLAEGKSLNNRFSQNIPNLGGLQQGIGDNEDFNIDSNSDRQSLIVRNNECVICMDNPRGKRAITSGQY